MCSPLRTLSRWPHKVWNLASVGMVSRSRLFRKLPTVFRRQGRTWNQGLVGFRLIKRRPGVHSTLRAAGEVTVSYGRPDHIPTGTSEVCDSCGVSASMHRRRNNEVLSRKSEYISSYNKNHPRHNPSARIIGIDGEGQGRLPHRYTYLAACDEAGVKWSVANSARLTTVECLDFILDLPRRSLIFGYAFLYDLTKILQDLPDRLLYLLFHEEWW